MKIPFDNLIECYKVFLREQEDSMDMGVESPSEATPAQPEPVKTVSQGYAHVVDTILQLFRIRPESIPQKYYNLSDNDIKDTETAYRYLELLTKLLPKNTVSSLKSDNVGDSQAGAINLDDATIIEMANVALKALFYSEKDTFEFSSQLEDIQQVLTSSDNKVTVNTANAIYQKIKSLVLMD